MGAGGRPRKIKTPAEMLDLWDQYKDECENHYVTVHEFSQKLGDFVSKDLKKPITYTIEGFCTWLGLVRSAFYQNYMHSEKFAGVVSRIKEECESDVRGKFETGQIPSQLSALWMSKFGYSTNSNVKVGAEELVNEWVDGVLKNGDDE